MSPDEIPLKAEQVKKRLFDSTSEIAEIERATIDQHTSILRYNVRQPRTTASKTKKCLLIKGKYKPNKGNLRKPNIQTKLMKEGIDMEPRIIERFIKKTGNVIGKYGFFISEAHPFLGASTY